MYAVSDESYQSHSVHAYVNTVYEFYHEVGRSPVTFGTLGLKGVVDIDRVIIESLAETMDSISFTLTKGRINDTYAMLRKYRDSITVHVYIILYLKIRSLKLYQISFMISKLILRKVNTLCRKYKTG